MAVVNQFGTTQITGDDIRDTINNFGGSASNAWETFFDQLEDVNIWSKWKPFNYPADFVDDESILKARQYGLNIEHMNNWGQVTTKWQTQYTWDKPTGGSTSPFRGGDFRNYTKNAVRFFNRFEESNGGTIYAGNDGAFIAWFNSPGTGSIKLSDIVVNGVAASDCYFGIVAVKNGTTNYYVQTDSNKVGTNIQFGVSFNFPTAYETWKVYPMLSSTPFTTKTLNPNNPSCVLCLPSGPITVNVRPKTELFNIAIGALTVTPRAGKITINMDVDLVNNSDYAHTFRVAYKVDGVDSSGNINEVSGYYTIISGQSVAAKTRYTVNVNRTQNAVSTYEYYIVTIQDLDTGFEASRDTYEPQ